MNSEEIIVIQLRPLKKNTLLLFTEGGFATSCVWLCIARTSCARRYGYNNVYVRGEGFSLLRRLPSAAVAT